MKMKIHTPDEAESIKWPNMTVLGVDPSMTSTGWSVITFHAYRTPRLVTHGKIGTDPTGMTNMEDNLVRMNILFNAMKTVVAALHFVDAIAIELPVPSRMGAASQAGSMACVSVNNAISRLTVPVSYVHPTHSKKVTTGDGKASKAAVKDAVTQWVGGITPRFNQDVADSMSASVCTMLDVATGRIKLTEEGFRK